MVFNTGPYTDLPDNSILITANMQSETGFPSSYQLKSYVASKSRPVLSADAGLLVVFYFDMEPRLKSVGMQRNVQVIFLKITSVVSRII